LVQRLIAELEVGRPVLWVVSGGSNIEAAANIMSEVPDTLSTKLTIMPVDERYGPPGHANSNWAQLMKAGFAAKQAKLLPALKDGLSFSENTAYYNELAERAFAQNETIIGQLGIGPDGHVAGILPGSHACSVTDSLVTGYEASPLQRMSLTFPALKRITAAYALAFGANKQSALKSLQSQDLPLSEQPAQILKHLREAYIYNDQVGEIDG